MQCYATLFGGVGGSAAASPEAVYYMCSLEMDMELKGKPMKRFHLEETQGRLLASSLSMTAVN